MGFGITVKNSTETIFDTENMSLMVAMEVQSVSDLYFCSGNTTATNGSKNFVGSSTSYTTQLSVGSYVKLYGTGGGGFVSRVASITDNTHLAVEDTYTGSNVTTNLLKSVTNTRAAMDAMGTNLFTHTTIPHNLKYTPAMIPSVLADTRMAVDDVNAYFITPPRQDGVLAYGTVGFRLYTVPIDRNYVSNETQSFAPFSALAMTSGIESAKEGLDLFTTSKKKLPVTRVIANVLPVEVDVGGPDYHNKFTFTHNIGSPVMYDIFGKVDSTAYDYSSGLNLFDDRWMLVSNWGGRDDSPGVVSTNNEIVFKDYAFQYTRCSVVIYGKIK